MTVLAFDTFSGSDPAVVVDIPHTPRPLSVRFESALRTLPLINELFARRMQECFPSASYEQILNGRVRCTVPARLTDVVSGALQQWQRDISIARQGLGMVTAPPQARPIMVRLTHFSALTPAVVSQAQAIIGFTYAYHLGPYVVGFVARNCEPSVLPTLKQLSCGERTTTVVLPAVRPNVWEQREPRLRSLRHAAFLGRCATSVTFSLNVGSCYCDLRIELGALHATLLPGTKPIERPHCSHCS